MLLLLRARRRDVLDLQPANGPDGQRACFGGVFECCCFIVNPNPDQALTTVIHGSQVSGRTEGVSRQW